MMRKFLCTLFAVILTAGMLAGTAGASVDLHEHTIPSSGGTKRVMTSRTATERWSSTVKSYIYSSGDSFSIVDANGTSVCIDTYDADTYARKSAKTIPYELPLFGGFYAGSQYNFLVFGQENPNKSDSVVTIKTVKYSKDWKKLGEVEYRANNTVAPFEAGSLRMTEHNGYLYVHTCHEMYNGHQANMTYNVNISTMKLADKTHDVTYLSYAYTSHSFNQFIKMDGNALVAVDHGDAYPRSVVLRKSLSDLENGRFIPRNNDEYWAGTYGAATLDLLTIPGAVGANCTGVTVGGFEVSANNYIVAINTINHSKVKKYDSFQMEGLGTDERNVTLLITDRNVTEKSTVKKVTLTDYIGKNMLAGTPYLVKISAEKFLVLWEEFRYDENGWAVSRGVRYIYVDENGERLSSLMVDSKSHLSADCQPVYMNGRILWYVNGEEQERTLYVLDVSGGKSTGSQQESQPASDKTAVKTTTRRNLPVRH